MATYPAGVYAPRTKVNKDGVVYDAAKTKVLFAEDVVGLDGEVVAVEEKVGIGASTPTAGKVLTGTAVGESAWQDPAGGGASTEVFPLIVTQINVSSIGDTYTDVAGETYAETTNQTRVTLTAIRIRRISVVMSGHVSAGTGTFQLWNNTDSASKATATTTSTFEAKLSAYMSSAVATNNGDEITIRVKNSGAGGTVTIDGGGMIDSDLLAIDIDTVDLKTFNFDFYYGGYPTILSVGVLRGLSSATFTAQFAHVLYSGTGETLKYLFEREFGTADAQTVFTITPVVKRISTSNSPSDLRINVTATSAELYVYAIGVSFQLKLDNI